MIGIVVIPIAIFLGYEIDKLSRRLEKLEGANADEGAGKEK